MFGFSDDRFATMSDTEIKAVIASFPTPAPYVRPLPVVRIVRNVPTLRLESKAYAKR